MIGERVSEAGASSGMQGAGEAAATSGAAPVSRMLDANAIGELLGREPRVVRRWCEPEGRFKGRTCPHTRVQIRKGAPDYRFNEAEVRAWAMAQGLDVKPPIEAGAGPVFAAAAAEQAKKAGTEEPERPVDVLASVPIGAERAVLREQLALVITLTTQIQRDLRTAGVGVAGISPTSVNQLAGAAEKASSAARLLDKAEREMAVQRGELVSRAAMERVITDLVDSVNAGHDQAKQDLGPLLRLAGAQIGDGEKRMVDEQFDRVVVVKAGEVLDIARAKAAEALRRARADVERLAGGERREAA